MNLNFKRTIHIIGNRRKFLFPIIMCFILVALVDLVGISLIIPYINLILQEKEFYNFINQYNLDKFIINYNYLDLIIVISILLILIFLLKTLFQLFINYILVRFELDLSYNIKNRLIDSYLNADYARYINLKSERSIDTLTTLTSYVSKAVVIPALRIFSDCILIIFISIFLAIIDFTIFSIVFIFLIFLVFIYNFLFKSILFQTGKEMSNGHRMFVRGVTESSRGYKEFSVLNIMKYFENNIDIGLRKEYYNGITNRFIQALPSTLSELILIIFFILIILFKMIFLQSNIVSEVATFGVFAFASFKLFPKFSSIAQNIGLINMGKYSIPIVYNDLLNSQKDLQEINKKIKTDFHNIKNYDFKSLKFENLSFKYPTNDKYIFNKLNFQINSNKIYGVFGPSGSGKTTLVDLILKFLYPTDGKIIFNNDKNFCDNIDIKQWHDHIAYIPQRITIIDSTILRNITMEPDEKKIDYSKLEYAVKISRLDQFINNFNDGLSYEVGEAGNKLSGGQIQRIAIARSIYFDRKILIFDEATNALDSDTEEQILSDLNLIKNNFTIIIITHREKVLKFCDKLLYLKNQKIEVQNSEK